MFNIFHVFLGSIGLEKSNFKLFGKLYAILASPYYVQEMSRPYGNYVH